MKSFMTLVFGLTLCAANLATAATMSCFVDTPRLDPYEPEYCERIYLGLESTTASFRIDPPLPPRFRVLWSDKTCSPQKKVCNVPIRAFIPKTMTARVLNLDTMTFFQVSATARLENGQ